MTEKPDEGACVGHGWTQPGEDHNGLKRSDQQPYGSKGSGWSGSDTSRERAEREDAEGITGWRMAQVHNIVRLSAKKGMTCAELEQSLGLGHGAVSAALTRLHKSGHLTRLQERREGQEVYVRWQYIDGRPESSYRPNIGLVKEVSVDRQITNLQLKGVFGDLDDLIYEEHGVRPFFGYGPSFGMPTPIGERAIYELKKLLGQ